jgi:hypothetical protein
MADDALIEETLSHLQGLTLDQGQVTWLTSDITSSETTIAVAHPDRVSEGVVEIGEELVFASSSDVSGVVVAPGFGRGYQKTTAAAWVTNTRVTMSPRFPRARIREAINYTIRNVYPRLFAVGKTEFNPSDQKITHSLPAEAERVLTVRQQAIGPYGYWTPIYGYKANDASTTEYATGKSIDIFTGLQPGQPVEVRYTKKPIVLTAGQAFTVSGLPDTAWPCVMYGAMHRLLSGVPAGLSGVDGVQAAEAQTRRRVSLGETAREFYALHVQLLNDERDRLLEEHDASSNWEG